jgi:hypothetical protein
VIKSTLAFVGTLKANKFIAEGYGVADSNLGVLGINRLFFIQMRAMAGKLFTNGSFNHQ